MSGKEIPNTPRLYLSAYFMCQHPVPFVVFCLFCFFHSLSMTCISHLFFSSSSESHFYVCVCHMFVWWMLAGGGTAGRRHQPTTHPIASELSSVPVETALFVQQSTQVESLTAVQQFWHSHLSHIDTFKPNHWLDAEYDRLHPYCHNSQTSPVESKSRRVVIFTFILLPPCGRKE